MCPSLPPQASKCRPVTQIHSERRQLRCTHGAGVEREGEATLVVVACLATTERDILHEVGVGVRLEVDPTFDANKFSVPVIRSEV